MAANSERRTARQDDVAFTARRHRFATTCESGRRLQPSPVLTRFRTSCGVSAVDSCPVALLCHVSSWSICALARFSVHSRDWRIHRRFNPASHRAIARIDFPGSQRRFDRPFASCSSKASDEAIADAPQSNRGATGADQSVSSPPGLPSPLGEQKTSPSQRFPALCKNCLKSCPAHSLYSSHPPASSAAVMTPDRHLSRVFYRLFRCDRCLALWAPRLQARSVRK